MDANPGVPSKELEHLFNKISSGIHIINSYEELEYFLDPSIVEYKEIDFSQYSILFVRTATTINSHPN